jgi:hypothetical protein
MPWPERGVYFFFEDGEIRHGDTNRSRVVRIGTHALTTASQSTLWGRLSQHRGSLNPRGGNHRGSIFRLLAGEAMMRRDLSDEPNSWGRGQLASREVRQAEQVHECQVSDYLGTMSLIFLPVTDSPGPQSARSVIERNSIALLSGFNDSTIDPPSEQWLGLVSGRIRVRCSGLWNNNYVHEAYDSRFLHLLDQLIRTMSPP